MEALLELISESTSKPNALDRNLLIQRRENWVEDESSVRLRRAVFAIGRMVRMCCNCGPPKGNCDLQMLYTES